MFWKDGEPFRIIGGDLHYFRVHPEVKIIFLTSVSLLKKMVSCYESEKLKGKEG